MVIEESRRVVDPVRACIFLFDREAAFALTFFRDRLGCGGGNEFAVKKIELCRRQPKAFSTITLLHPHHCQLAQFGNHQTPPRHRGSNKGVMKSLNFWAQTRTMPNRFLPHFARKKMGSDVGLNVRTARQSKGYTRKALAKAAEIRPHTLARIERGAQKPRVETIRSIADALKVSLGSLAPGWAADEQRREENFDHLGPRLRKVRRDAGVSLKVAAAAAGVDPSTLSRFERMQTDSLLLSKDGETFFSPSLAKVLGFGSVDDLSAACSNFYS